MNYNYGYITKNGFSIYEDDTDKWNILNQFRLFKARANADDVFVVHVINPSNGHVATCFARRNQDGTVKVFR